MDGEVVDRLDEALVHLRRLWSGPAQPLGPDERDVELSSVLMVEAWARLAAGDGAVSIGALGRFVAVRPSTATRLVERAIAAGLLERVDLPGDARRRTVRATADGRAVRERAVSLRTGWLRTILADWPSDDVDALSRLLERFAAAVRAHGGPGASPADGGTATHHDGSAS